MDMNLSNFRAAFLAAVLPAALAVAADAVAQAAGGSSVPASAASTTVPLPAEVFFSWPEMAQPLLSPSGRYMAVLMRGAKDRNSLGVIDLEEVGNSKGLLQFGDVDIGNVRWLGDERLIFSVVDLQAGMGERRIAPGLFVIDRDGKNYRELVKLRPKPMISGGPAGDDRRLDYNHKLLHVPAQGGDEIIVGELVFGNDGTVESVQPLRLNVKNMRAQSLAGGAPPYAMDWLFDAAAEPRFAQAIHGGRVKSYWRAQGKAEWKLLKDESMLQVSWSPYAMDIQGGLFVTTASGAGGTNVLSRFDFTTNKPEPQPVVTTPGFDFKGEPVSESSGSRVLGFRAQIDAETTVWLDPAMKAAQTEIDKRMPGRVNRLTCRRCDDDKQRVLLIESFADRDPGTYLLWRSGAERPVVLGRWNKQVEVRRMAGVSFERIRARDGADLPVWMTYPPAGASAQSDADRPAVVLVHGGPWVRGSIWAWHGLQQFLASRGYVVIEPEFRGSSGYGSVHLRAGWRQWGQAMQDDVADAVLWAAKQKLINPQRVCIAGGSYGGYSTLMGLVRQPELYRCGAAWLAVTDMLRFVEGGFWTRDDIGDEWRSYGMPTLVGDAKLDLEMLKSNSPVEQASKIRAPVLLAYGGDDQRVPLVYGKDMRDALKRAGNEPEWIVYDGEAHGFRKMENQLDFARRLEAFFAKHLK